MNIGDAVVERLRQRELLLQPDGWRLDARIHLDDQRMRVAPLVHGQLHRVGPWRRPRCRRGRHGVVRHGGDRQAAAPTGRGTGDRLVMKIPDKSMHTRGSRQRLRRPVPVERYGRRGRVCAVRAICARVLADDLTGAVDNLQRHRRRRCLQRVIYDRALGRILRGRLVGRQRRVGVGVPADAIRDRRLEQHRVGDGRPEPDEGGPHLRLALRHGDDRRRPESCDAAPQVTVECVNVEAM